MTHRISRISKIKKTNRDEPFGHHHRGCSFSDSQKNTTKISHHFPNQKKLTVRCEGLTLPLRCRHLPPSPPMPGTPAMPSPTPIPPRFPHAFLTLSHMAIHAHACPTRPYRGECWVTFGLRCAIDRHLRLCAIWGYTLPSLDTESGAGIFGLSCGCPGRV